MIFSNAAPQKTSHYNADMPAINIISSQGFMALYKQSSTIINSIFKEVNKSCELVDILNSVDDRRICNIIRELFLANSNRTLLRHLHSEPTIYSHFLNVLQSDKAYQAGIAAQIMNFALFYESEKFFNTIVELPSFFATLVYHLDSISVFQLFEKFLSTDFQNEIKFHPYFAGWTQSISNTILDPIFPPEIPVIWRYHFKEETLNNYKNSCDYHSLFSNPQKLHGLIKLYIKLFEFFSEIEADPSLDKSGSFADSSSNNDSLDSNAEESLEDKNEEINKRKENSLILTQISEYFATTFCIDLLYKNYFSIQPKKRGTQYDDCIASIIKLNLFFASQTNLNIYCIDALITPFTGSALAEQSILYLAKNLTDKEIFGDLRRLTNALFMIYYIPSEVVDVIQRYEKIKKTNNEQIKRQMKESYSNNLVMISGLKLIRRFLSIEDPETLKLILDKIISMVFIIWEENNHNVIARTFVNQICELITTNVDNPKFTEFYENVVHPISEGRRYNVDYKVVLSVDENEMKKKHIERLLYNLGLVFGNLEYEFEEEDVMVFEEEEEEAREE